MKKYIVATVLIMMTGGVASAQESDLNLTLKDAVKMAVEKNLDVRVELYNPASAEADIRKARGIYNPVLTLYADYQNSNTQESNTFLTGGASVSRVRSDDLKAGITQAIPTGGSIGVVFDNLWNHNNFGGVSNNSSSGSGTGGSGSTGASGVFINNYFQSQLTFNFTQPLLKNFGRETTELTINVAKFSREGALEQFRFKLQDIISQVKSQYNQLYSLRKNLEVKKTSLQLAETILNNTQAQVKAGVLPAMETLNAQFGAATRQKELIDAERALKDQVDVMRVLLQLQNVTDIIPVDTPFKENYPVEEADSVRYAMAERPDLKQQRVTLNTSELQLRVARHQTLPQLDFNASVGLNGLSRTLARDMEKVGSGAYPVWITSLQLTYPIGNDSAENDYVKSKLKVEQTKTQVKSLEETISRDVRAAVRAVTSGYKQLEVTARGRAYAEEVVQAYIKKQKVGLATTKDVLDVLNNMVTAQGAEIQAVTDYNNAIVTLWKSTGELLVKEGITLDGKEADALYMKNR